MKYSRVLEIQRVVHTIHLDSRSFISIHTGGLSNYIAEVYPFQVSWILEASDDDSAIKEGRARAYKWLANLLNRAR